MQKLIGEVLGFDFWLFHQYLTNSEAYHSDFKGCHHLSNQHFQQLSINSVQQNLFLTQDHVLEGNDDPFQTFCADDKNYKSFITICQTDNHNIIEMKCFEQSQIARFLENQIANLPNLFWHKG